MVKAGGVKGVLRPGESELREKLAGAMAIDLSFPEDAGLGARLHVPSLRASRTDPGSDRSVASDSLRGRSSIPIPTNACKGLPFVTPDIYTYICYTLDCAAEGGSHGIRYGDAVGPWQSRFGSGHFPALG